MPLKIEILMSEWMETVKASKKRSGSRNHKVTVVKAGLEHGVASLALALWHTQWEAGSRLG